MKTNLNKETKELGRKKLSFYIVAVALLGLWALISKSEPITQEILDETNATPPTPTMTIDPELIITPSPELNPNSKFSDLEGPVVVCLPLGRLALFSGPGLETEVLAYADDGTVFNVLQGPITIDGRDWYQVQDPKNGNIYWTASHLCIP